MQSARPAEPIATAILFSLALNDIDHGTGSLSTSLAVATVWLCVDRRSAKGGDHA
jgi:hypothetical protein